MLHFKIGKKVTHRQKGFPVGSGGKESACKQTRVPSLSQEDPLEEGMATHSSILAWRIPWKDKPDRLQPVGSQRVGQDRATTTHSGQEDESRSAG